MKRTLILLIVLTAIAGVVVLKKSHQEPVTPLPEHLPNSPRLLDLGSKGCTACTLMEPVLKDLSETYTGQLQVDFIDVWEHKGVAEQYGIEIIPVQILFDASGQEIYRHKGFISAADIVTQFKKLGIDLHDK